MSFLKRPEAGALAAALLCALAACSVGPDYKSPAAGAPPLFHAPLPHGGAAAGAADGGDWWAQFDDPLVRELVDAAQAGDPGVARALARIDQARAILGGSAAAQVPALDAQASVSRASLATPPGAATAGTHFNRGLDASWEIDLFGLQRKGVDAARARLAARVADWHVARISLAAEVALTLLQQRACVAAAAVLAQDLASREQTGQLTALKVRHGLSAPADGNLIAASNADARQRLTQQQADCDLNVKALVALTDVAEDALRPRLRAHAQLPRPRAIAVAVVPAQALAQRPDIAAAERALAAAGADINVAQAQRYPRLSLLGSISVAGLRLDGQRSDVQSWSFGPGLSLPVFDGGRGRAAVELAQARFDEAQGRYRQAVREAVRGTEEALVRLDAAARRETDAATAAREYEQYFQANQDSFKAGNGSLFELEEARRNMLGAHLTFIAVQRDRVAAWIALYKALGGGWQAPASAAQS